jgi:hypothetical protein
MGLHAALLSPKGCSSWIAYQHTAISSFLRSVLMISVISLAFLPCGSVLMEITHQPLYCPLLNAAWPDHKLSVCPSLLPSSFFQSVWAKLSRVAGAPTSPALNSVCSLFFCFKGGQPLHNAQSCIFHSLMKVLTNCFIPSRSAVFLNTLPDILSFLRCSCSFKSWSLHSLCVRYLLLNVHPLGAPLATLSLTTMSLVRCRNGTVGHPSVGGSQLLPGPTITLGLFLWLLVAPYCKMPIPIPI